MAGPLAYSCLFEQIRNQRIKQLGPDHRDTLVTSLALAMLYRNAGEINEAIKLDEDVWQSRVATLGLDHWETLLAETDLGQSYRDAGQTAKPEIHLKSAGELGAGKIKPELPQQMAPW